jgi:predicted DNA-binding transcriptional regulator AlpA
MPDIANDNEPRTRRHSAVHPRGLRRVEAARYIGISPTHFDKQVRAGTVPKPLQLFGVNVWDRVALDALFDGSRQPANDNDDYWDRACGSENPNT